MSVGAHVTVVQVLAVRSCFWGPGNLSRAVFKGGGGVRWGTFVPLTFLRFLVFTYF